jgi:hypothetical protein
MRLINTSTLLLDEFFGDDIPKYAILSHTWTKEEVTFREWLEPTATTASKAGFVKVKEACAIALSLSHEWLWADTACIDKTSSAELSEAINSMFAWYRDSTECLVYLTDVEKAADGDGQPQQLLDITASRWFERGWTLQELLAPADLTFYDRHWRRLGTKVEYAYAISPITGIKAYILTSRVSLPSVLRQRVAERMSWMARRRTKRVEDMAYCMLGIFDINMPLLYGEGDKAFRRLQHEILRSYHDHTILAWTWMPPNGPRAGAGPQEYACDIGVLASSPTAFAGHESVIQHEALDRRFHRLKPNLEAPTPYSVTNLGLSIRLPVRHTARKLMVVLDARSGTARDSACHYLAITLEGSSTQWTLPRSAFPHRPFRFCSTLPTPPAADLFLALQVDDLCQYAEVHAEVPGPDLYGLLLTFEYPFPGLAAHPRGCLSYEDSLITFPSDPTAWTEMFSLPGEPHLHVRSTAVVLCLSGSRQNSCVEELVPDVSLLFTLSVVTAQGTDGVENIVLFGHPVQISQDWHPDERRRYEEEDDGETDWFNWFDPDQWFDQDPRLREALENEMKQVFQQASERAGTLEERFEDWNRRDPEKQSYSRARMGTCDLAYPGFKEARMVLLDAPASSYEGDEDYI